MYLDGFNQAGELVAETNVRIIAWTLDDLEYIEQDQPALELAFDKGINFYLIQNWRRLFNNQQIVSS